MRTLLVATSSISGWRVAHKVKQTTLEDNGVAKMAVVHKLMINIVANFSTTELTF